jgi:hypothetical protein
VIRPFLVPLLDDLRREVVKTGIWTPGGPCVAVDEVEQFALRDDDRSRSLPNVGV